MADDAAMKATEKANIATAMFVMPQPPINQATATIAGCSERCLHDGDAMS